MRGSAGILIVVLCSGCPWPERPRPTARVAPDLDAGAGDADTDVDTDADTDVDVDTDTDSDFECDPDANCIDVADPEIPPCSDVGDPCRDDRDCLLGRFCLGDAEGWPDGYCIMGGPVDGGACDPNVPESCPEGTKCTYTGRDGEGVEYHYCFKACVISDRNPWDQSSCGCRDGYACDLLDEICVPGCTEANVDEQCCPPWGDREGYPWWGDDEGPDCTVTCNEEAFRCYNPGDADASWGDPCTLDQDCPELGVCLRERDADGDLRTPERSFVGGYCTRYGCDLDGRECVGDCRNLGTADDPTWMCVKSCTVADDGADPWAVNGTCGSDYGCHPDTDDPEREENGYCWAPPRYNDVRDRNMGQPCEDDDECYSPFGQGFCLQERGGAGWLGGTCGLGACDFPGMEGECLEPDYVCEMFGSLGICLDRCTGPGEGFGLDVGCRDDDYACYPSGVGGGAGVCFPSCAAQPDPDAFCESFFDDAPNCDVASGLCAP